MEEDTDLKPLQEALTKNLVELTRTSAQLAAEDLSFFRVSYPKQAKQLDRSSAKILQLSRKLLQSAAAGTNIEVPSISGVDALDDEWSSIVEVVDNLLEKTDVALDEYTGAIKKQGSESEANQAPQKIRTPYKNRSAIPKPQLLFNRSPQNEFKDAFKPLLRTKPHAQVPLEQSLTSSPLADQHEQYDMGFYLCLRDKSPLKNLVDSTFRFKQPYEKEIEQYQYPPGVWAWHEPIPYKPFAETTATFVDTPEAVSEMLSELRTAKEIAVDLEHHDKHSYIGLVSLMQISTRDKDWIVDTLKPWREDLQVLNEVFADPSILKVFHGAKMDIIWLQRDLGLYVVGLFDTYHASNCLDYPRHSLAFLLDKFTGVKAQKQYQMADWRVRPLSSQLFEYARSDTHYLLYIYDEMRNELVAASKQLPSGENLVDIVLERSKQECLQKFEFRQYDAERGTGPDGWFQLLIRTPALFTKQQFAVFRAVHQWRDEIARREDESINFVMQKQTLFNIARHLPTTLKALYGCAQPMSDLMRDHAEGLLAVVQKGIAAGEHGPEMQPFMDEHPETIRYNAARAERSRVRGGQNDSGFSVGEIMQRERSKLDGGEQVPLEQIQSQTSAFWGSTIPANGTLAGLSDSPMLEVPLPPNVTVVDSAEVEAEEPSPPETEEPASNTHAETFVLRDTKKRKSKPSSGAEPSTPGAPSDPMLSDTIALAGSDSESDAERDARRARKATRRAEKARQAADKAAAQRAAEDETPFDYAAAPSVLDAKPPPPTRKGVNPYAKAMDTSKGARKAKREQVGKSATFSGAAGGGGSGGGASRGTRGGGKKKKK